MIDNWITVSAQARADMFSAHRRAIIDIAVTYVVVAAIIGAVIAAWQIKDIPVGDFTRDPANTFDSAFYVGSVSYIGAILWTATATICLFASVILRSGDSDANSETIKFLFASGLLTAALLFDDLFLFHEIFFPRYFGIPDFVTFSTYAVVTLIYLYVFRRTILQTHFGVLILAGVLLGLAMVVDKLYDDSVDTSVKFLIEDGLKFVGIATWFVYYVRLAFDRCCAAVQGKETAQS